MRSIQYRLLVLSGAGPQLFWSAANKEGLSGVQLLQQSPDSLSLSTVMARKSGRATAAVFVALRVFNLY